MKFPEEACDDGNTLERRRLLAATARSSRASPARMTQPIWAARIALPIIYRDFRAAHPHFEVNPGHRRPRSGHGAGRSRTRTASPSTAWRSASQRPSPFDGRHHRQRVRRAHAERTPRSRRNFNQWYVTDPAADSLINRQIIGVTDPDRDARGQRRTSLRRPAATQFFPLDGMGFNLTGTTGFEASRQWPQLPLHERSCASGSLTMAGTQRLLTLQRRRRRLGVRQRQARRRPRRHPRRADGQRRVASARRANRLVPGSRPARRPAPIPASPWSPAA